MRRSGLLALVVGSCLGLAVPALVVAAAPEHEAVGQATRAAGSESTGPDLFEWRVDLAIWTVIVFLGLYFVLRRWAWGPMIDALQKREQSIRNAIEDARKAREEAERLRGDFQHQLDNAHEQVRAILDEARRDAQHTGQDIVHQAQEEAQRIRERNVREIERARDQALKEIVERTADLVAESTRRIVQKTLTPADHQRLIEESLAELSGNGKS